MPFITAIPHTFRVRLQQLSSKIRDTRLRLFELFSEYAHLIFHELPWSCLFAHFIFGEGGQLKK